MFSLNAIAQLPHDIASKQGELINPTHLNENVNYIRQILNDPTTYPISWVNKNNGDSINKDDFVNLFSSLNGFVANNDYNNNLTNGITSNSIAEGFAHLETVANQILDPESGRIYLQLGFTNSDYETTLTNASIFPVTGNKYRMELITDSSIKKWIWRVYDATDPYLYLDFYSFNEMNPITNTNDFLDNRLEHNPRYRSDTNTTTGAQGFKVSSMGFLGPMGYPAGNHSTGLLYVELNEFENIITNACNKDLSGQYSNVNELTQVLVNGDTTTTYTYFFCN